jgi:vacuolar-type H+-ATPase subunit E/Vma4
VSLEAILKAIHATGEVEVREIEARTREEIEELLAQTEAEIQRLREEDRSAILSRDQLARIRTDPIYPTVLRCLTIEALVALEGSLEAAGSARLDVDPRDKSLLESILFDLDLAPPVNYELVSWGGVIVRSQDGRIAVVNTLEARLERATPYLRRLMDALFQEEQWTESPTT